MTDPTEVFEYLDNLRESGITNMFGAGPYVQRHFGIQPNEARKLVVAWMDTFDPEEAPEERVQKAQFEGKLK
jgi:hypothetical protein